MPAWTALSLSILVYWFQPMTSSDGLLSPQLLCDIEVDAGPDTSVCYPGGVIQLMGSVSAGTLFYQWSPSTGLNNAFILNPTANITGPITYTLTGFAPDPDNPNLVVNGDFSAGNTGFDSDYNYVADIPGNQSEMVPEGTYTVINNPNLVHTGFSACGDHTTGSGNMMVVNGAANFQDIWCQTITVSEDAYYNVSAWVASVNPSSPAQLQFSINGTPIGAIVNAIATPCVWSPFNAIWSSGSNTTAEICILNLNTALGGNDFALDDISLISLCSVSDDVEITIYEEEAPEPVIDGPDFVCEGDLATYTASFPPEPPIYEYQWTVPNYGVILSGQGTTEITVQWDETGEVSICLDIETRCEMNAACYDVTIGTLPDLPFINGTAELCPGESEIFYTAEQDPDDQYVWTLPPNVSIISGQGTNEIEVEWATPGDAELCVAITNQCGTTENCTIIALFESYHVLFDTVICEGTTFDLNGTTYGNGVLTGTEYFLSMHGCDSVVEVEVMEAGVLLYPFTHSLCPGDSILLEGAYQTQAGVYIDSFVTASGCDSIIETTVLISALDTTLLFLNTCDSTLAGTIVTAYSLGSCDSIVIEEITFIPPDTTIITGESCSPADTGYTVLVLNNSYGCDSVIITDINLLPSDTTQLFDTSCDPTEAGTVTTLLINRFGCDSLVIETTSFLLSDTTYLQLTTCAETDTGIVQNLYTNSDGCDSLVITHTGYGGSDITFHQFNTCIPADSGWSIVNLINGAGCDSVIATYTTLLLADTTYLTARSCSPQDTGLFTEQWLNIAGCDSTVYIQAFLIDPDSCGLEAVYSFQPALCYGSDGTFYLELQVGIGPFDVMLIQGDQVVPFTLDTLGSYILPSPLNGEFLLSIHSPNGFSLLDTILLDYPDPLHVEVTSPLDFNGYALACFGDQNGNITATLLEHGTPPVDFTWSTGDMGSTLYNLGTGTYHLTVTDVNGCTDTASIMLSSPEPIQYVLLVDSISCFGEFNGGITITSASGGISPWVTSLNGIPFGEELDFQHLAAGSYILQIEDQNSCTSSDTVLLEEPSDWSIELGPDTTIAYGTAITLSPVITGMPGGNVSITWSDGVCDDCQSRTLQPTTLTDISITVVDDNGCISSDALRIHIVIDRDLIVPNVFTPNNDNINDVVMISASSSVKEISWFRIYDRWGNLVFGLDQFQPNDPQYAWDGKMDGALLNPAVFTYQLLALYQDGFREVRFGDITLLR